jgi:hypothetical protein
MLRESARATDSTIDLKAVTSDEAGDGGIPHGSVLTAFAEAALGGDEARLIGARRQVREELGDAALVDSAAVIANYSALDRVADATGIPLEAAKEANTVELRAELGIDDFAREKDRIE